MKIKEIAISKGTNSLKKHLQQELELWVDWAGGKDALQEYYRCSSVKDDCLVRLSTPD